MKREREREELIFANVLSQQMPEEEAFAVLVALMQEYRLRDMFKPSMAELGVCMYQLEHLIADTHPELHAHFTAQGFNTSMYASSWFLTLFTTALSLPLACRIFDVFLSEGMEIIFKVALAMLHLGKEDMLSLDMEGMLKVRLPDSMLVFLNAFFMEMKKFRCIYNKLY